LAGVRFEQFYRLLESNLPIWCLFHRLLQFFNCSDSSQGPSC
jgi:hypothetical protein